MSISDKKYRIIPQRVFNGLVFTIICAVFGAIYEKFSHGVYSSYMIYAFLIPLFFSVVPNTLWILFGKKDIPEASRHLWNYGIATITVGCMLKGVLEIYGTTNRHLIVYPIIAGMLIIAAVVAGIINRFGKKRVRENG